MKTRLLGAALATVWFLSLSSTAWAQGRSGGHHASGNGRERAAGGNGHTQPRSAGTGPQTQTAAGRDRSREDRQRTRPAVVLQASGAGAPRIVTAGASRLFFSQPYYAFRPRQHVGSGLYLGYPVAYPSLHFYSNAYPFPYGYYPYMPVTQIYPYTTTPTYPYTSQTPTYPTFNPAYGYPTPGAITIAPSGPSVLPATAGAAQPPAATGGVSFEITPGDAAVFVDGVYIGTANDFSATAPPLLLAAGRHHFELRAQSYQPMAFDVDVAPGQVVPYRGTMQP